MAVAEARILTITPWDGKLVKAISKAIQQSDIGINPIDDGHTIRLVFPAPTEERRKQLAKDVQKLGEESKVAVRNVRRDAMDKFKAMKKAGELTEDDQKNLEEETQKLTDKFVKKIDASARRKTRDHGGVTPSLSLPAAAAAFAPRWLLFSAASGGSMRRTAHRYL